jgi:hypothetical protein
MSPHSSAAVREGVGGDTSTGTTSTQSAICDRTPSTSWAAAIGIHSLSGECDMKTGDVSACSTSGTVESAASKTFSSSWCLSAGCARICSAKIKRTACPSTSTVAIRSLVWSSFKRVSACAIGSALVGVKLRAVHHRSTLESSLNLRIVRFSPVYIDRERENAR